MPREYNSDILYMTAAHVATMLSVHVNTVKRIPATELPYVKIGNRGDRRYRTEDVIAFLRRNTVNGNDQS